MTHDDDSFMKLIMTHHCYESLFNHLNPNFRMFDRGMARIVTGQMRSRGHMTSSQISFQLLTNKGTAKHAGTVKGTRDHVFPVYLYMLTLRTSRSLKKTSNCSPPRWP